MDCPTSALDHIFIDILCEVDTDDEHNYLENLNEFFSEKLQANRRFPGNREFKRMFTGSRDMYNFPRLNYLLQKLENYQRNCQGEEPINLKKYTIEHIMPQKLNNDWKQDLGDDHERMHERYLNDIGNLTLTGRNSELGNRRFQEKRDLLNGGFRYSSLHLNQSLRDVERWDSAAITKRGNELAEKALEIWILPDN